MSNNGEFNYVTIFNKELLHFNADRYRCKRTMEGKQNEVPYNVFVKTEHGFTIASVNTTRKERIRVYDALRPPLEGSSTPHPPPTPHWVFYITVKLLRCSDSLFFTNLMRKFFILIHLLHSSTCFEHYCAHLQEDNCISTASAIVTVFG